MSSIIKSILKNNSDLNSNVIEKVNEHIKTKKYNQTVNLTDNQIQGLVTKVFDACKYEGTWFKGFKKSAIKSSIKQYLREEETKAIAHLLNEVRNKFKQRSPKTITDEEIEAFAETIKDTNVPKSGNTYGQLLTSEKIEHIVKNWHKIALILAHNKIIQVNKQDGTAEGRMVVTQNAKPIQQIAKSLNKNIDGELLLKMSATERNSIHEGPSKKQDKKEGLARDKAFVATFKDEFYFSPIEKELLYNAINKKIIAVRAGNAGEYTNLYWNENFKITSNLIKSSLKCRDDAYGRPINYSTEEIDGKQVKVINKKERKLFDDFAEKFNEPDFVDNIQTLCDIKKANPELVEEAGLYDFRLFELIKKFAPSA